MDVVLQQADIRLLDSIYTSLFPLSAFSPSSDLLTSPTLKDSALTFIRSVATKGCSTSSILESSSVFPRDSIARQLLSLFVIAWAGSLLLYFSVSTLSYYYLFDRRLEHHPRFLKNQIRMEIELSVRSMPIIAALIVPWFVYEIRGHTLMYSDFSQYGASWFKGTLLEGYGSAVYAAGSCAIFLAGTDYSVYWIHRWLHVPFIYKRLHKPHHKWVVPTPFASLAFHPLDGYAQSVPYHLIPLVLPIHKWVYLSLFLFVNLWTILIHDGDMISGHLLEKYINSPAHHTLHHLYFTCNYGQYFTWADSWGGSYRPPRPDLDPIHESIKNMERKRKLAEKELRVVSRREASLSLSSGSPLTASALNGLNLTVESEKEKVLVEVEGLDSDSGYEGSEGEEVGQKKGKKEEGEVRRRRR